MGSTWQTEHEAENTATDRSESKKLTSRLGRGSEWHFGRVVMCVTPAKKLDPSYFSASRKGVQGRHPSA